MLPEATCSEHLVVLSSCVLLEDFVASSDQTLL